MSKSWVREPAVPNNQVHATNATSPQPQSVQNTHQTGSSACNYQTAQQALARNAAAAAATHKRKHNAVTNETATTVVGTKHRVYVRSAAATSSHANRRAPVGPSPAQKPQQAKQQPTAASVSCTAAASTPEVRPQYSTAIPHVQTRLHQQQAQQVPSPAALSTATTAGQKRPPQQDVLLQPKRLHSSSQPAASQNLQQDCRNTAQMRVLASKAAASPGLQPQGPPKTQLCALKPKQKTVFCSRAAAIAAAKLIVMPGPSARTTRHKPMAQQAQHFRSVRAAPPSTAAAATAAAAAACKRFDRRHMQHPTAADISLTLPAKRPIEHNRSTRGNLTGNFKADLATVPRTTSSNSSSKRPTTRRGPHRTWVKAAADGAMSASAAVLTPRRMSSSAGPSPRQQPLLAASRRRGAAAVVPASHVKALLQPAQAAASAGKEPAAAASKLESQQSKSNQGRRARVQGRGSLRLVKIGEQLFYQSAKGLHAMAAAVSQPTAPMAAVVTRAAASSSGQAIAAAVLQQQKHSVPAPVKVAPKSASTGASARAAAATAAAARSRRTLAARRLARNSTPGSAAHLRINKAANKHAGLCLYYCRFGECGRQQQRRCGLIHDPAKVAVCVHWLQGSCSLGTACKRQHKVVPELMPVCTYFQEGKCGNRLCPYLHIQVSPDAPPCQDFLAGFCPKGASCTHKHLTPRMLKQIQQKAQDSPSNAAATTTKLAARATDASVSLAAAAAGDVGAGTPSVRQQQLIGSQHPEKLQSAATASAQAAATGVEAIHAGFRPVGTVALDDLMALLPEANDEDEDN